MPLTRWDPFSEITRMRQDMGRAFQDRGGFSPAVDIFEDEESITLRAEVPGLPADALDVNVEAGVLTLRGERKLENEEKKDGYHRIERSYGAFTRSFVLPKTVDAEHIDADLSDGVLTVRLPKRRAPEPKRIEVKSA
jgi:HSP20 family protein